MIKSQTTAVTEKITIMGIGNILYSDEGVGVHILPFLEEELKDVENIEIIDGATEGIKLLSDIESTENLIIIDAINGGKEPGTLYRIAKEEIPKYAGIKMSIHQISFRDVLSVAALRKTLPKNMVLIGIQPEKLDLEVGLSETVQKRIPDLIQEVKGQILEWRNLS